MRFAYPLVLLVFFVVAAVSWLSMTNSVDPTSEAQRFMKDIEAGDVIDAVKQFGSNMCHCPAKGGWVSYLIYQSGQEHNLAFMLGHPFQKGAPNAAPVPNDRQALLPWQKPEDYIVDFPITFDANRYAPLFLPLKMAYGKDMTAEELQEFLKDPDKDSWQGFTLRLRPSLDKGAVNPPVIEVPDTMKTDFQAYKKVREGLDFNQEKKDKASESGKNDKSESGLSDEYIRKSFGDAAADYLIPADAGQVLDKEGKALRREDVARQLPHLEKTTLRLHVVRRDKIQEWTIYHFALENPVLAMPDGSELVLQHHQRPKSSLPAKQNEN